MAMIPPFFIVGFQRSGTTLLRLMLDSHPAIAIPLDTTGLWSRYAGRLDEYDNLATISGRERIVKDLLGEERIRLWEATLGEGEIVSRWHDGSYPGLMAAFHEAFAASRGKTMWGDKDPGNMLRMDLINRWFPDSRFIHIIRDGRAACLSQLKQDFGFNNLLDCACSWREEVQWVRRMGGLLGPGRYHELRYEDLVAQPREQLELVCAFLHVPYDEAMMRYHESVATSVPADKRHIWPLLDRPPVAENADLWKQQITHGQRVCFEKRAGPVLHDMGYDVLPGGASGAYLEELRNLGSSAWNALRRRLKHA